MTFMARLAPDLRDPDTVCLNIYFSLNFHARWDIFGKRPAKLLNCSEQSIIHGSVTLKPISRSNRQCTMKKIVSSSLDYCSGIRPFVKKIVMVWTIMPIVRDGNLKKDDLLIDFCDTLWKYVLNYVFMTRYFLKWTKYFYPKALDIFRYMCSIHMHKSTNNC